MVSGMNARKSQIMTMQQCNIQLLAHLMGAINKAVSWHADDWVKATIDEAVNLATVTPVHTLS